MPGADLALDWSVPVSYWIGPDTAAVLHIRRFREEDDAQVLTETSVDLFCRVDGAWEAWGGGGGGWKGESPLTRVDVLPGHVDLHGANGGWVQTRGCKALWGEVGTAAAVAEVEQAGSVTRHPVVAPVGAFVVCADYAQPLTVRILDQRGELLAEIEDPAGFEGDSPDLAGGTES